MPRCHEDLTDCAPARTGAYHFKWVLMMVLMLGAEDLEDAASGTPSTFSIMRRTAAMKRPCSRADISRISRLATGELGCGPTSGRGGG